MTGRRMLLVTSLVLLFALSLGPLSAIFLQITHRSLLRAENDSPLLCCSIPPHHFKEFDLDTGEVMLRTWFLPHRTTPFEEKLPKDLHQQDLKMMFNASNNDATVIVVHGHGVSFLSKPGSEETVAYKAVLPLHAAGYNVLAFDQRNHGRSGFNPPVTLGLVESRDIESMIEWLVKNGSSIVPNLNTQRIGLWGESMGAATVIFSLTNRFHPPSLTAPRQRTAEQEEDLIGRVKVAVIDSSFSSFSSVVDYFFEEKMPWMPSFVIDYLIACIHLMSPYDLDKTIRPIDRIQHLQVPILLAHGTRDHIVPFDNALEIKEAIKKNPNIAEYVEHFFDGRHVRTYDSPGYFALMIDFFERHL